MKCIGNLIPDLGLGPSAFHSRNNTYCDVQSGRYIRTTVLSAKVFSVLIILGLFFQGAHEEGEAVGYVVGES